MPVIINGSTGISGTDGSAGTPALQGTDGNTGMYFPAADQIAFAEGGVEAMRLDASGNVGIGTTTPSARLDVFRTGASAATALLSVGVTDGFFRLGVVNGVAGTTGSLQATFGLLYMGSGEAATIKFYRGGGANDGTIAFTTNNGTERARINEAGQLLVGTTGNPNGSTLNVFGGIPATIENSQSGSAFQILFRNPNGNVGSITSAGTSTSYNTSSDYRLKQNIAPLTDAAARVEALKPCRFNWTVDPEGAKVDGFLAHEAAEVVPEAINGEKDAVDADGKPIYQGIDHSKLVPLLTAALQEALTEITALKARVAALEAR